MKKLIFSICAVAMIATIGCKSGPSSSDPKATLMAFFGAMAKKDMKEARKYATKESESMLSMMEMGLKMAENMKNKEDNEFGKFEKDNMSFGDAKIEGDKATVPVTSKKDNETTNFILKKEGGAWKVAFDKASMAEMGGEKMKDNDATDMNLDTLANSIKNIDADTLKEAMQKGIEAIDTLKEALKAIK